MYMSHTQEHTYIYVNYGQKCLFKGVHFSYE